MSLSYHRRPYWIIEHPSRGAYIGMDYGRTSIERVPRFRWSVLRSHEQIIRYQTKGAAQTELDKLSKTVRGCYLVGMQQGPNHDSIVEPMVNT